MKKDILIMCQYFSPEYISSAILPTELAEDLSEKNLTVDVICGYPKEYYDGGKITRKEKYKGINISRVKYTKFNKKRKIGRLINFFSFFIAIFFKMFKFFKYKIIIVYSNPPILPLIPYLVSRLSRVKFIYVVYDVYPDSALKMDAIKKGSLIEKKMKFINKKVYNHAAKIVTLGNEMKQYLIDTGIASKPDILEVIPNWYCDKRVENQNFSAENDLKILKEKDSFIVHYSGNMGTLQDIDTILKCMLELKDNKALLFFFAGHGNKVELIKKYLIDNGIKNAKVYGFLRGRDYSDALEMADVCLVSLEKDSEGLGVPSKTYGYLAYGKPVLAVMSKNTDIAKKLYEYNAGKSIIQADYLALKDSIIELMDNRKLLDIQSRNAKKLFLDLYDRKICTGKYYDMILEIINN